MPLRRSDEHISCRLPIELVQNSVQKAGMVGVSRGIGESEPCGFNNLLNSLGFWRVRVRGTQARCFGQPSLTKSEIGDLVR